MLSPHTLTAKKNSGKSFTYSDIGFVVNNCSYETLYELEPWCSIIYVNPYNVDYIQTENVNTLFDLNQRVRPIRSDKVNDIMVKFDGGRCRSRTYDLMRVKHAL